MILERTCDLEYLNNKKLSDSDIIFKIKDEEEAIGVLGIIKGGFIYITYLEIYESYRRKGNGIAAVMMLKSIYSDKDIHGIALESSLSFWNNVGAEFLDEDDETGNVAMLGHMPFIIKNNTKGGNVGNVNTKRN